MAGTDKCIEFELELDKFQLAQGNCKKLSSGHSYSYGGGRAKLLKTAARKKKEFISLNLSDTDEKRLARLEHALAHKKSIKYWGSGAVRFVDEEGKELLYTGMAIGGEHDWDYVDADWIEQPIGGEKIVWKAQKVRWREVKVHGSRLSLRS